MPRKIWVEVLLSLAVAVPASGLGQSPQSMPMESMHHAGPAVPAGPLKVTFGDRSAEWTPEKLAALPHKSITVYNGHAKANQTYSGVPVLDLLTPLGVPAELHGKDYCLYLVAEGSDGYQVVYAIAELYPDVHDGTVLVADSVDGKPLGDSGALQIVSTGEKHPARWVRNLVALKVKTAE